MEGGIIIIARPELHEVAQNVDLGAERRGLSQHVLKMAQLDGPQLTQMSV
jgi:hypothetical protein